MSTVVFDVGNVVIRWDPFAVFPEMPRAEIQDFFDEVGFLAWNLEQDRGRPWAEAVSLLSAFYPHRAGLIERFRADWMRSVTGPVEGTAEIVEALGARGHVVHAITNFSREKWEETIAHYPILTSGFGQVIVSGHEGVVKPDPRIYDLLCKRAGFKPQDALFVDDSALNVAGARAIGMAAHHFHDAPGLRAELEERGLL